MARKDVSILRHFADLPDPRIDRTKKHPLGDILVIALCAVVAGADTSTDIEGLARTSSPLSPAPA